jgi:UDP-N-acetylmuramoyl-tripeptide--D-alanyl-D-alanine ligase
MHDLYDAATVAQATGGRVTGGAPATRFAGVSTDTRTIGAGDCFVALVGPNFNGHDFIQQAIAKGATGALVSQDVQADPSIAVIRVADTTEAMGELAKWTLVTRGAPVIAITGSTGKTTSKEMCNQILEADKPGRVLCSAGNFNNLIGLPLTVLRQTAEHEIVLLEMGMSMRGEIRRLAEIANPGIGVITNVSAVHLEHLKNTFAVAEAKGELLEQFGADHIAVLNFDDPLVSRMGEGRPFRAIFFSADPAADVEVKALSVETRGFEGIDVTMKIGDQTVDVTLSTFGRHNVQNALAAAAAAYAFGVPIETIAQGLEAFRPAAMRSKVLSIFGVTVIDDSYNANPRSMDAALSALSELAKDGRKIAVLGDMFELGDESEAAHRRLGRHAAKMGVDRLFLLGDRSRQVAEGAIEEQMATSSIVIAPDHAAIVRDLRENARRGDVILVKGSRGMRMEQIVRGLKGEAVG